MQCELREVSWEKDEDHYTNIKEEEGGKGLTRQKDCRSKFYEETLKACTGKKSQRKEKKQVFK